MWKQAKLSSLLPVFGCEVETGKRLLRQVENHFIPIKTFLIYSNKSDVSVDILAYASIIRNLEAYPQTLGYYIEDFNAYKISR